MLYQRIKESVKRRMETKKRVRSLKEKLQECGTREPLHVVPIVVRSLGSVPKKLGLVAGKLVFQ